MKRAALLVLMCACSSPRYVVVTPAEFADALGPLVERRNARVLTLEEIGGSREAIRAKLAELRPAYALLVGDADRLPTWIEPSAYVSDKWASDEDLATDLPYADLDGDEREEIMVGRLPADTAEEVAAMVANILAREDATPDHRLKFVVGEAGFSPAIDAMIEKAFRKFVADEIPQAYDIEIAYANPKSVYCWPPAEFNDRVLDLYNDGALIYTYVGHGRRLAFDTVRETGDRIFHVRDVPRLSAAVPPIMVVLACSTAHFDHAEDCVGERAMARRGGPAAFIGGTRIEQPYASGLLGRAMIRAFFDGSDRTLGEVLRAARAELRFGEPDDFGKTVDAFVATVQGKESLGQMRRDGIRHFNLFGDPAMRIARPRPLPLSVRVEGEEIVVSGDADGPVEVTLEVTREAFKTKLKADATRETYFAANDKVVERAEASGRFEVRFARREGPLVVKARGGGAAGAAAVP